MKGDFTRFTHDPAKRYAAVLQQQGRVTLDADWNEHVALRDRLARITAIDVIGPAGVPQTGGGFAIGVTPDGIDFTIDAGRMYVDGILCDLDEDTTYSTQPYLPEPPPLDPQDGRTDLVYLDVWRRHVTAVEDDELRDPALNGLDTTTRLQTVWQVRVLPGGIADEATVGELSCDAFPGFPLEPSGALLSNAALATPEDADPCAVIVAGGYRGLENRLYRVEIHDGGGLGEATFMWSRDNGSVLFGIEEILGAPANQVRLRSLGPDQVLTLHGTHWVEIEDDATEFAGEPGFMARVDHVDPATRIVTLDRDLPADTYTVERNARIRRWDQDREVDGNGLLLTAADPLELEDGVHVSFAGNGYRPGDYWTFAARTAGGTIEERTDARPDGIHHHYAPLAVIEWSGTPEGGFTAEMLTTCTTTFPPLTDICADDVCYDNSTCDLPGAATVQEALDQLCQARDLRFHNQHLHGWGIVCGLQVACGPSDDDGARRQITLRPGYAIACEGHDVLVDEEIQLDLVSAVEALDAANPDAPILDENSNGDVCLVLAHNGNGPFIRVEHFGPQQSFWERVMEGTLLQEFYDHCLAPFVDFVADSFTSAPGSNQPPIGPGQERASAIANIVNQLTDPLNGQNAFVSAREHAVLRNFYDATRALLNSETFCALFADARPFPAYPFPQAVRWSVFGSDVRDRVRMNPSGTRSFAVGRGNTIHVADHERQETIASLEFPGGRGVDVEDLVLSPDGRRLHAIATDGSDSFFATATVESRGDTFRFGPVTVICNVRLITLAAVPDSEDLLAVGLGTGVYSIQPDYVSERAEPLHRFNASGHLVIGPDGTAYATARAAGLPSDGSYDRVLSFSTREPGTQPATIQLEAPGKDEIAFGLVPVAGALPQPRLYVPVGGGGTPKRLLVYDPGQRENTAMIADIPVEDTPIRLGLTPDFVVLAFRGSHGLALLDRSTNRIVMDGDSGNAYRIPTVPQPGAVAVGPDSLVIVRSAATHTTDMAPRFSYQPPGEIDREVLAEYRDALLAAFLDLAAGFLQYLKDCFCDHFLVNCPECDEDDQLYLACASIRGGEVYKVCNFSRRKYVKTFPTVEHWLSAIPIIPLVREIVATICCAVVPDWFGDPRPRGGTPGGVPQLDPWIAAAAGSPQAANRARRFDLPQAMRDLRGRSGVAMNLLGSWLAALGDRSQSEPPPPALSRDVVGRPVAAAEAELRRAGAPAVNVAPYDPGRAGENLRRFLTAGGRIPTDRPVTLYEEDGVVRAFRAADFVAAPPAAAERLDTQRLKAELTRLSSTVEEFAQAREALAETQAQIATLRSSLEESRRNAEYALAEREQEIATLRESTRQFATGLQDLKELRAEVERLRRQQPPR